jgi:hypothetical protein
MEANSISALLGTLFIAIFIIWLFIPKGDSDKKTIGGTCPNCGKDGGLYEHWTFDAYEHKDGSYSTSEKYVDYSGCKYCEKMAQDFSSQREFDLTVQMETEEMNKMEKEAICTSCGKRNDSWVKKRSVLNEELKNGNMYVFVEYSEVCIHCSHKKNIRTKWEPK